MEFVRFLCVFIASAALLLGEPFGKSRDKHPPLPKSSAQTDLDRQTSQVAPKLPQPNQPPVTVTRKNYIDAFIFGKMDGQRVPHAPLSSDTEFLRRVYLDLTGRIPQPEQVRKFLADQESNKRDRLVDQLTDAKIDPAALMHPSSPFLDRWTYFFGDLLRNAAAEIGVKGRNLFWDYLHTSLLLDQPYNQLVTELLTARAVSNWQSGPSNFLARNHVDDADDLSINHEDTIEDIAISSTKYFLGVNLECIACHAGAGHLEKINLYLSRKKREELWRHASFFGGVRIYRAFGIGQEFAVREDEHRFNLKHPSVKRMERYSEDITPTFLVNQEKVLPGEGLRQAYARILTTHPQFARATVNLLWAELMGVGIVDPPFEFDLDRQDPTHPPPAPWTVQPSHPELLDALAKDFVANDYSLRHIMRVITKSSAYQLSSHFPGEWKPPYASYFARHFVRRLSAEQLYDAIAQSTDIFVPIAIAGSGEKVQYVMQTHCPRDLSEKELVEIASMLSTFGQSNRDQGEKSLSGSMMQTSSLLNSRLVKDRVQAERGRLATLLKNESPLSNEAIVDELFLATLSRFPSATEKQIGVEQIRHYREAGAEDLLWALLNKTEFLFNH